MIKILNRFTNNLICEQALLDLKALAVNNKANLREANLREAKITNKEIISYKDICGVGNSKRQIRCFMLDNNSFYFMAG